MADELEVHEMTDTRQRGNAPGTAAEAVAENVGIFRRRLRMRQEDLAVELAKVGRPIPLRSVSKIESGLRRVDVDDLLALAAVLHVSTDELLTKAHS